MTGLGVSIFSKPLAVLLGVAVVVVQALERMGVYLVPYGRLQRYFRGVDWRRVLGREKMWFKIGFGVMFGLSGGFGLHL